MIYVPSSVKILSHAPPVHVRAHQTTLQVLDLSFCELGQEGGQYLARVLHQNVGPVLLNQKQISMLSQTQACVVCTTVSLL